MSVSKRVLLLSIILQLSVSQICAAAKGSSIIILATTTTIQISKANQLQQVKEIQKNIAKGSRETKQKPTIVGLSSTTTVNSSDDDVLKIMNNEQQHTTHNYNKKKLFTTKPKLLNHSIKNATTKTNSTSSTTTTTISKSKEVSPCTPSSECELCPYNYKVLIEKEDEKIKGEYDSCLLYGRRKQFECTVLFQESESSKKQAQTHSEFRSCRYTNADEQYRMLRMQMICLLVGFLAIRNVKRQKVTSASLFDQRRMRIQNSKEYIKNSDRGINNTSSNNSSNGGTSSSKKHVKYLALPNKSTMSGMETIELTSMHNSPTNGGYALDKTTGKVPKSPAPNRDLEIGAR